jgi:hypothetical protein
MLTANASLAIRGVSMVHHSRALTGGTVQGFDHHPRHAFPRLDAHDTAAPLVCLDQGRSRKSTNLGHYQPPEGVSATRRLETTPHGTLRSREASPSQRSSLQGLLPHGSSDHKALHFTPIADMYICLAAAWLSRGATCAGLTRPRSWSPTAHE